MTVVDYCVWKCDFCGSEFLVPSSIYNDGDWDGISQADIMELGECPGHKCHALGWATTTIPISLQSPTSQACDHYKLILLDDSLTDQRRVDRFEAITEGML